MKKIILYTLGVCFLVPFAVGLPSAGEVLNETYEENQAVIDLALNWVTGWGLFTSILCMTAIGLTVKLRRNRT